MNLTHIHWLRSDDPAADRVLAQAGRELARYVGKLTGAPPVTRAAQQATAAPGAAWLSLCDRLPAPPAGALTPAAWDDGYAIWATGETLYIAGRNARSVLFGVYVFLETQGVRFVRPGPAGEVIPHLPGLTLPAAPIIETPRYRHRGVCIEGATSLDHALGMVDWCAKRRLNTVFLQFIHSGYFYNQWYARPYNPKHAGQPLSETEVLAYDDRLIAAMKRRGLVFHRVGHGWTSAAFGMPRSGWVKEAAPVQEKYVRWLAEVNGERKLFKEIPINTELCYSFQPAFDAFIETIVRYCEAHPELDVVHVWLSDAFNNKCECAECRPLSPADWYARIINALSEALHRRAPRTRFVFLAYFELWWPPEQVQIDARHGNAILMFAPITRCFGHALGDGACDDGQAWPRPPLNQFAVSRQNAFYGRILPAWRQAFAGDSFDFDYHLMWAVWQQLTDTLIARVLYADLGPLKELGLDGVVSCQSFRAFYPSGLAMAALADGLWNPDRAWDDVRRAHLAAAFGPHADFADEYLRQVEGFLDTGDPHRRTRPFSTADAATLAACAAFLAASQADLAARARAEENPVYRLSLALLANHAELLGNIAATYQARAAGDAAAANAALDRAAEHLRRTEPRFSPYIDAMLALRLSVEAHRPA
jgi:hypothetical protein